MAVQLEKLWGSKLVSNALREVVVSEEGRHPYTSADSDLLKSGRIFYDIDDLTACEHGIKSDKCQQIIFSHEVAHNLEFLLTNNVKFGLLQKLYLELIRDNSEVFYFISESQYNDETSQGGHPDSNASELFASATSVLIGGADRFKKNLEKSKKTLSKEKYESLKADLKKLFSAYRNLVKRFNSNSSFDFDPFISL